ncbi:Cytochrome c1 heme lyase [Coemansia sp. RSA 988]|nr:Cytochrome c1 heme lyase [Coemansia sp. RSA 988]
MATDSQPSNGSCTADHSARSATTSAGTAAKCPIDHSVSNKDKVVRPDGGDTHPAACPADHGSSLKAFHPSASGAGLDPHNNMPKIPEQHAGSTQQTRLSTERTISSIPRADRYDAAGESECPALHEQTAEDRWIYPSEQMFFNAMRRKNWNPSEPDMKTVVPIHNVVNEMCWKQILEWESYHQTQCGSPKLLRFEGKAKDLTPKARLRSLIGFQRPFDRHDWTVDRCGKPVRYVIDFYEGRRDSSNPDKPSFFLDVRPALTAEGAWDRTRRFLGF